MATVPLHLVTPGTSAGAIHDEGIDEELIELASRVLQANAAVFVLGQTGRATMTDELRAATERAADWWAEYSDRARSLPRGAPARDALIALGTLLQAGNEEIRRFHAPVAAGRAFSPARANLLIQRAARALRRLRSGTGIETTIFASSCAAGAGGGADENGDAHDR